MMAHGGVDVVRVCNIDEEGRFGGPERRITLVAAGLPEFSVETTVFIPDHDSEKFESELQGRSIGYERINVSRLTLEPKRLLLYIVRFPWEVVLTAMALRRNSGSLVHVNGSYQFRSAIAARLAGKKLAWHVNDAKVHWLVMSVFQLLATRLSHGFIFSSRVAKDYYFPAGLDERFATAFIPPPVEIGRFKPKQAHAELRAGGTSPVTVVTLTGINPDKGNECLVETAAKIYKDCPRVRILVGAALHKSQKRHFAALMQKVRACGLPEGILNFIGFVDDVPRFLEEGDIFLYTSNTEAGPAAVWEAMAAGLPVVTTNVGAIPELLRHGFDAMIAEPRDSESLARMTLELIGDRKLREMLGRNARATVEQSLSVAAAARLHSEFYRTLAKL